MRAEVCILIVFIGIVLEFTFYVMFYKVERNITLSSVYQQNVIISVNDSSTLIVTDDNNKENRPILFKTKRNNIERVVEQQFDCLLDSDIRDKPINSTERGEWIYNRTAMRINTTATWKRNVGGCARKRLGRGYWKSELDDDKFPHIFYKWKPKSKCLNQYKRLNNLEEFCTLINGRKMFFFGDSVLRNLYDLFKFAFGVHEEQGFNSTKTYACIFQNKPFELQYEFTKRFIKEREVDVFLSVLNSTENAIFVLNTGRHYREDDMFTNDVKQAFQLLNLHLKNNYFFYWSTLDAFMPYWNETIPLSPTKFEYLKNNLDLIKPEYSYSQFHKQNEIVRNLIRKKYPSIVFLDTREPMKYRSDSMGDSVHWCLPGALDNMLEWLYNVISSLDEHKKIPLTSY